MSTPDVHDLNKDVDKISMRRFTALASETRDPTREAAEGDIYEVEDEENLPQDAKAQTIALFRNEEDDEDLPVHVWVNDSDQARHTGLSNHEKLDRDEGMLFDWGEFSTHGLTMRDMSFPIDMVFLDKRGYVQQIVERVQPDNPGTYTSACQYALEMPSGFCEKHKIDTDWRVFREVREFQTNPDIVELQEVPDEAVSYTDPDDVPENARTITGPQGGNYYIPADEDRQEEDPESESGLDLSEREAEIGDDSVHPAKWRRPAPEELDDYINEIQDTAFWSDGHESFKAAFDGTDNTENEYTDEEGNWDEERLQKHREWASELLNDDAATEEGEEPVGVILLGPPGAGKGWWQEQVDEGEYGESFGGREFTHISSDKTKEPIPEYNGENAAEVHDEASRMAKQELAPQAFEDEHNVIVDKVATSPESTIAMVEAMQDAGYDIRASFVDVPEEKSVHNAVGRYEDEGRFTPLGYTSSAREDSRDSFEQIVEEADIPDEKTGVFNNDVEWGEPPEPVEMGEDLLKFYRNFFGWDDEEMNRFMTTEDKAIPGASQDATRQTRPGDRDRQRDSRVDGRELRRGAERGDRAGSGPIVVDLDKQSTPATVPDHYEYVPPGQDPGSTDVIEGPDGGIYADPEGDGEEDVPDVADMDIEELGETLADELGQQAAEALFDEAAGRDVIEDRLEIALDDYLEVQSMDYEEMGPGQRVFHPETGAVEVASVVNSPMASMGPNAGYFELSDGTVVTLMGDIPDEVSDHFEGEDPNVVSLGDMDGVKQLHDIDEDAFDPSTFSYDGADKDEVSNGEGEAYRLDQDRREQFWDELEEVHPDGASDLLHLQSEAKKTSYSSKAQTRERAFLQAVGLDDDLEHRNGALQGADPDDELVAVADKMVDASQQAAREYFGDQFEVSRGLSETAFEQLIEEAVGAEDDTVDIDTFGMTNYATEEGVANKFGLTRKTATIKREIEPEDVLSWTDFFLSGTLESEISIKGGETPVSLQSVQIPWTENSLEEELNNPSDEFLEILDDRGIASEFVEAHR